jgi:hypothetical protein
MRYLPVAEKHISGEKLGARRRDSLVLSECSSSSPKKIETGFPALPFPAEPRGAARFGRDLASVFCVNQNGENPG